MGSYTRRSAFALFAAAAMVAGQPHMARAFIFSGGIVGSGGGALSVPVSLNNLDASNSFVQPNVTIGFAFADGDVPAGGSVTLKDSLGNPVAVQQDEEAAPYASGCISYATLCFKMSETINASSVKNYTVGSSASAPNRTPNVAWNANGTPEATLIANSDWKVAYTNFDTGNVYTVSVNDILTNFNALPNWGTATPQGGYQRIAAGPNKMAWRAWKYLKNDSSGFYQGYVRCVIYLTAWSPTGPFECEFATEMVNDANAITNTSEQWALSPTRFAYTAQVKNGATVVANAGGPNDSRATTFAPTDVSTSNFVITGAFNAPLVSWDGLGVGFQSTGALPGGLATNTTYFGAWRNGGSSGMAVLKQRGYAQHWATSSNDTAWAGTTGYVATQFIQNPTANKQYVCTTAGTSAASGGPTGNGSNIVDGAGALRWDSCNIQFSSQGTGTHTMYPVYIAYQQNGNHICDVTCEAFYQGSGTRPQIVGGQDITHLFTKTKAVPSYATDITGQTPTGVTSPNYNPMSPPVGFWFLNSTGEGPGDPRIGIVMEYSVNAFYVPSSAYYYRMSMNYGLAWASAWTNIVDIRGGQVYVGNNGPAKNGTAYTNMPTPQPNFNSPPFKSTGFGTGNWLPQATAIQDIPSNYDAFSNNQWITDTSHMPRAWYGAYLKTGRRALLDIGMRQGAFIAATYPYRQNTLNAVNYYSVVNGNGQGTPAGQLRGWAWAIGMPHCAHWVCPSYEPAQAFFRDVCADNAAYMKAWYDPSTGSVQAAQRTFGIPTAANHLFPCTTAPWMYNFLLCNTGWLGWQGVFTDWNTFNNFAAAWFDPFFQGTNIFALSTYDLYYGTGNAESNFSLYSKCFQTAQDLIGTSGLANFVAVGTIGATATVTIVGTTMTVTGVSGVITANATLAQADVVSGAGIAANTRITADLGGGSYTVSVSQNVGPVSGTIKSAIVQITSTPSTIYAFNNVASAGVPSSQLYPVNGSGHGTTGAYFLGNNDGTYISQASFVQVGSQNFTLTQNNSALPAYAGPAQPWMTDFGNNVGASSYPYWCNWYGNPARSAIKMMSLALPGNANLPTYLATLTANIKSNTGISTTGGFKFFGTDPSFGSNVTNHMDWAIY